MDYDLQAYGQDAWLISFKHNGFSKQLCLSILRLAERFRQDGYGWREIVPAYDSLLIQSPYDRPRAACEDKIKAALGGFSLDKDIKPPRQIIEVPVYYGGADGPDLESVSERLGLGIEDIIHRHSAPVYLVCLMGFIPGFAFLSGTDKALHIPRRAAPRGSVPAGSVGLAGWQTGIYGLTSPGGWQIIGRTPLVMFEAQRNPPFLLKAGDWIRFVPQERSL